MHQRSYEPVAHLRRRRYCSLPCARKDARKVEIPDGGWNPSGLCMCGCGERTPIATGTDTRRKKVAGQPQRYVAGHQSRKSPHLYLVDEASGCWVWQRARTSAGYPEIYVDGGMHYAHRHFYEANVGAIPEGLELDHLCRNRACVNPAHLEPVTTAENGRRGRVARGVWAPTQADRERGIAP